MNIRVVDRVHPTALMNSTPYYPNRSPLQSCPFQRLPPGSIRPEGWLKIQLTMQLTGLNGRLTDISDYLIYDQCGWIDPNKLAWEEMPYWLRGFADLAFVTGDVDALKLVQHWIDGILNSQQSDGWFGPNILRYSLEGKPDLWPAMLLINVLRSYYEYSNDNRVIQFLLKYFQFINNQSNEIFKHGWAYTRWSDNIDSIIWLFNRTNNTDWLLDLIHKIHSNAANWMNNFPTRHNVNIAQGFREPALYSLVVNPSDPSFIQATYNNYEQVMNEFGQFPGGGFAGDENCRQGFSDPRQGFETCGIVEFMHSFSILTRLTGDGKWADQCEILAFNSLPAALDPFLARSTHYITCPNSIQLDNKLKTKGQFQNIFPMLAFMPGVYHYRCCAHNYGFGWPYYSEELWLATWDNGICASMYAASQVTAFIGSNNEIQVTVVEETEYPFDDIIYFHFQLSIPTKFNFYLRIPQWCQHSIELSINGKIIFNEQIPNGNSFLILDRIWTNNDIVTFKIPMTIQMKTWLKNHNSVSLSYGPLSFSLDIDEQWNRIGGQYDWPQYEVLPKSHWNYGLILTNNDDHDFIIQRRKKTNDYLNPFTRTNVPLQLEVRARCIPSWKADDQNVVGLLPQSPVASSEPDESIKLIPMGAARLRITAFPTIVQ
ncbi:unnamed protein product [Rotaria sordida]|uniref:Transcriptional initiation protein Tat n=2 Tax=Rotaria sordida TaxID=392033 RepID=A0A818RL60_9BILA|nr:unnamed protein product [Rotaria sordida]CAF3659082.1 unnamed protein product [Rotaria sordida]